MKFLRKMPDGQRATLSRSRSSKCDTLILVFSAIDASGICRRSGSRRSRLPKLSSVVRILAVADMAGMSDALQIRLPEDLRERRVLMTIFRTTDRVLCALA